MGDDLCMAEVQVWADGLAELGALIGRRFSRSEPRERALDYMTALLAPLEKKKDSMKRFSDTYIHSGWQD